MIAFLTLALTVAQPPAPVPVIRVSAAAYSPDGSLLAVAVGVKGQMNRVTVWNDKNQQQYAFDLHDANALQFTPDGSHLIAGGQSLTVVEAKTGRPVKTLSHDGDVAAIAVGPKDRFATGGIDGTTRIWDSKTFAELVKIESVRDSAQKLAISSDGTFLARASYPQIRSPDRKSSRSSDLWDAKTGKELKVFDDSSSYVAGLGFSVDGTALIRCVGNDGTLTIHETKSGIETCRLGNRGGINRFDFSPTANLAVTTFSFDRSENFLSLYSFRFGKLSTAEQAEIERLIRQFDAEAIADREAAATALFAFGLAAEPYLKQAMVESPNPEIRLRARKALIYWREQGHKKISLPQGRVTALAIAPDGSKVACGCIEGDVKIVDVKSEKIVSEWKASK